LSLLCLRSPFQNRRVAQLIRAGFFAIVIVLTAQTQAQKVTVHLDPATTEIHWTLSGSLHTTHGTFRLKSGEITLDPSTGAATGELLVDLASGESGDQSRDAKMQIRGTGIGKYPAGLLSSGRRSRSTLKAGV
jgi:hypothetical protein